MKNLITFTEFINESQQLNEAISIKHVYYADDDKDDKKKAREFAKRMNSINWEEEMDWADSTPSGTIKARCDIYRNEDGSLKSFWFSGEMNKWQAAVSWRFDEIGKRDNGRLEYWKGSSGGGSTVGAFREITLKTTDEELMDIAKEAIKELISISNRPA